MKIIDILGEIKFEESMEIFNGLVQLDEEYESIIETNSRLINEEDMLPLEDLRINIMSNGGSIWMYNAICDKLDDIKAKGVTIYTHGVGIVASAGLRIFLQGDIRTAGKNTHFLLHNCQVGFEADDLVRTMEYGQFLRERDEDFEEFLVENTKITRELLDERKGKDYWFDYDKALELGVVSPVEEFKMPKLTVDDCVQSFVTAGYDVVGYTEELEESSRLTKEELITVED